MITSNKEYTPSSTWIVEFQLLVRKQVEYAEEFVSVKDETTAGIQDLRKFLKSNIVKIIELKIMSLQALLATDLFTAIHIIISIIV